MTDSKREIQKKRILYQSWYRGCKETDKIIGGFARTQLDALSDEELDHFDALLKEDDRLLYDILTHQKDVPDTLDANPIIHKLLAFDVAASLPSLRDGKDHGAD